jgi:hypothetical protein
MVSLQADETEEFYETLGRDHVDTDTVADLKMTSCHYCVTGSHGKCLGYYNVALTVDWQLGIAIETELLPCSCGINDVDKHPKLGLPDFERRERVSGKIG